MNAALEATRPLFQQRNHQLEVKLPQLPCRVLGDHARLTQVLTNLLNNAAKYTPTAGHIELALEVDSTRNMLTIDVRDDGEGIPAEMLTRIFEIFVQGRQIDGRSHSGLGIGLNLVRRLVELHGGCVSASSEGPGRGTQVHIELPTIGRKL
jgi:signal transduction histidine kinase